jgi:hypothetical protein
MRVTECWTAVEKAACGFAFVSIEHPESSITIFLRMNGEI